MDENKLARRKLILLVEGNQARAAMLERIVVQGTGCGVLVIPTGRQAITTLNVVIPDLVVCARHLSDMQGMEIYEQIPIAGIRARLPFLLIGAAQTERENNFLRLRTPLALNELIQAIEVLINTEERPM